MYDLSAPIERRTCLSLLATTRAHLREISLLFDVSEQSVLRASLQIATDQANLKDLIEHPERTRAVSTRDLVTQKMPVGLSAVDDAKIQAICRKLYARRRRNFSGAVDAAVRVAWLLVRAEAYLPSPASSRGPFVGQRRPVKGGRS